MGFGTCASTNARHIWRPSIHLMAGIGTNACRLGISSAPEVFQKKMHELIEGLRGIEVVADDFVVVGYDNTVDEANVDHDKRLHSFLQRCEERGVKLNVDKFKLRQEEVRFIGHVTTSDGLGIDPTKVKAIVDMPNPTDVPGVQRLLGLAQYLAKFLPHLSDITKPLRDLTRNDTEWVWETSQQNALDTLKKSVASTPLLRYYNLADEVTIQCDASQSGLGAALMQNGQPVVTHHVLWRPWNKIRSNRKGATGDRVRMWSIRGLHLRPWSRDHRIRS